MYRLYQRSTARLRIQGQRQGTASHPLHSGLKDTRALAAPRCYFSPDSLCTVGVGGGAASRTFELPKKSRAASVFSALLSLSALS